MSKRPFQVDLRGVVELLSRHIYSSPQVYLRELLQNGVDAVASRHQFDPQAPSGELRISPATGEQPEFSFTDNGIGLTADEASEFLATVGRSSKRDELLNLRRRDYLGQFGIGILACFMVADAITVRSRSARGGAAIEWVGSADGTFTVRELSPDEAAGQPIGTRVSLHPRPDEAPLVSPDRVAKLAAKYGEYLPCRIVVASAGGERVVSRPAWFVGQSELGTNPAGGGWLTPAVADAASDESREVLGARPFDLIALDVPGSGTRGIGFVLPYAPPLGLPQPHRVYLGRMLLAERATDLLPDWAFFVRCVLNTDELSPTASREQLVDDSALEFTRDELGRQLRRWILQLAKTRPHRFAEFLAIHQLAIKAMVLQDDELAAVVLPLLSVETSDGVMTIADLARRSPTVRYTATVDEFRQVAAVAREPLVNGGYTFETELVRRIPEVIAGTRAELIRVADLLDELDSPPLSDHAAAMGLETRAMAALAEADCQVVARIFQPADVSGLFVVDPEVLRRIERRRATDAAPAFWARVLSQVDDQLSADAAESEPSRARLCLNWTNPVVQELVRLDDDLVFDRTVKMLYVQARLAGHHPLEASDRRLLNSALTDLVQLGIARDS